MREPKCALKLPTIIGQTPPSQSQNPGPRGFGPIGGDRTVRFPSPWQEAGCRWAAHIHRLCCDDVNAALIASNAPVLCSHCTLREGLMIGVLTHHWAKVDRIDEARKLLDRNGEAQSKAPGFVSRQTLIALADATKITTL